MTVKASVKHLRVSPRKARLVADMIRGLQVQKALNALAFSSKSVALDFSKLLKSAINNADQKGGIDPDNLYISRLEVGDGPTMKRFMPRARGMASSIMKRTSHIKIELEERV